MTKTIDEYFKSVAEASVGVREHTNGTKGPLKEKLQELEALERKIEALTEEARPKQFEHDTLAHAFPLITFDRMFGFETDEDRAAREKKNQVDKERERALKAELQGIDVQLEKLRADRKILREAIEVIRTEFDKYGKYYFLMSVFDIDEHDSGTLEKILGNLDALVLEQDQTIDHKVEEAVDSLRRDFGKTKDEIAEIKRLCKALKEAK